VFRRTLGSAAVAAAILAADLVVLTLFLNPEIRLRGEALALLVSFFLPYLVLGTAALALLALLFHALWGGPRASPPLLSGLPFFPGLAFLALSAAAALFWMNLLSYRHSIPVEFLRGLFASGLAVSAALLVLLAVGVDLFLFPRRGRALSAALVVLAPSAAVILPLALRPLPAAQARPLPLATETIPPTRRVLLVGVDGLGPDLVASGVTKGNLPAFARILKRGAAGPLATLRPTEGPPVWTTILTGRLPRDHGVKSFATYRLLGSATTYELLPKGALVRLLERVGLVSTRPVTSTARKRRALWNALNAFGIPTGIVRIWGTYPPERVQGFMLSPYFHLLRDDPARAADTLYPRDLIAEVKSRSVPAGDVDEALLSEFVDPPLRSGGDDLPWRRDLVERALAPDLTYRRAGSVLRAAYDPPFFATYFYGLDVVGHAFLRFAHPESFGDVRAQETRRYGRVLDRYQALLSQWVGEMEKGLRPGEILVVVSGYGMEPVPLWRRLLDGATGGSLMSGTHAGAPDGFFMAVGDGVRPGAVLRSASVLDVAPTLLYLIGLPVARDMEGRVLTEILDEEFAQAHAVTFIPSYESLAITPITAGGSLDDLPPLPEEGT
jgi:predicted AlkP superfamily phosphohydrolase/phosphomutase